MVAIVQSLEARTKKLRVIKMTLLKLVSFFLLESYVMFNYN